MARASDRAVRVKCADVHKNGKGNLLLWGQLCTRFDFCEVDIDALKNQTPPSYSRIATTTTTKNSLHCCLSRIIRMCIALLVLGVRFQHKLRRHCTKSDRYSFLVIILLSTCRVYVDQRRKYFQSNGLWYGWTSRVKRIWQLN